MIATLQTEQTWADAFVVIAIIIAVTVVAVVLLQQDRQR